MNLKDLMFCFNVGTAQMNGAPMPCDFGHVSISADPGNIEIPKTTVAGVASAAAVGLMWGFHARAKRRTIGELQKQLAATQEENRKLAGSYFRPGDGNILIVRRPSQKQPD